MRMLFDIRLNKLFDKQTTDMLVICYAFRSMWRHCNGQPTQWYLRGVRNTGAVDSVLAK